jgi:hypothetical protein
MKLLNGYIVIGYKNSLEIFFVSTFTRIVQYEFSISAIIMDCIEAKHPLDPKRSIILVSFSNLHLQIFYPLQRVSNGAVCKNIPNTGCLVWVPKHNFILTTTCNADNTRVLVDMMLGRKTNILETVNIGKSDVQQGDHVMILCNDDTVISLQNASKVFVVYRIKNERSSKVQVISLSVIPVQPTAVRTRSLFVVANRYLVHVYCQSVSVIDSTKINGGAQISYIHLTPQTYAIQPHPLNAIQAYPIALTDYFCVACVGGGQADMLTYFTIDAKTLIVRSKVEIYNKQVSSFAVRCLC